MAILARIGAQARATFRRAARANYEDEPPQARVAVCRPSPVARAAADSVSLDERLKFLFTRAVVVELF
jgi:hypothetical protein